MDTKVDYLRDHQCMTWIFHRNIAYMKQQIKQLACSFDWKRVRQVLFDQLCSIFVLDRNCQLAIQIITNGHNTYFSCSITKD